MLPKAASGFTQHGIHYPWAFALAGVVMLALGWSEACSHGGHGSKISPIAATIALAFHSLLAGLALGAEQTEAAILVLSLALIAHKGAASFALSRVLVGSSLSRSMALTMMGVFIAALPLGVGLGFFASETGQFHGLAEPVILALGAGTFLHFGTTHHHFNEEPRALHTGFSVIAGFALMAVIAIIA